MRASAPDDFGVTKIQRTCTCSSSIGVVELMNVNVSGIRSTPSPRPNVSRVKPLGASARLYGSSVTNCCVSQGMSSLPWTYRKCAKSWLFSAIS